MEGKFVWRNSRTITKSHWEVAQCKKYSPSTIIVRCISINSGTFPGADSRTATARGRNIFPMVIILHCIKYSREYTPYFMECEMLFLARKRHRSAEGKA